MTSVTPLLVPAFCVSVLAGCRSEAPEGAAAGDRSPAADTVHVELADAAGRPVGEAHLSAADGGVRIAIQAAGLPPGPKGFHIHETGRCDPPSFQSAGGHFNPFNREHGLDNPEGPHAGDLPNLTVGADGTADTTVTAPLVTLRLEEPHALFGPASRALVIHAGPDDYASQPSGGAGDRLACGVIAR